MNKSVNLFLFTQIFFIKNINPNMSQSKEPSARWLNKPRIVRPEPKIKESKELEVKFINPKH